MMSDLWVFYLETPHPLKFTLVDKKEAWIAHFF